MTMESWRESEGETTVGGNIEKDIDREGEKGKKGRESVCMFGQ